ncbi:MAG TPA: hypothetical protein VHB02_03870 [Acidimicrobiales bacterium]|nr:hypothetical protein [Acidimicrobiales bacterium]
MKRLREAVVVVVVAAVGLWLAAWLLAGVWPLLLVLGATVGVLSVAIRKR